MWFLFIVVDFYLPGQCHRKLMFLELKNLMKHSKTIEQK